RSSFAPHFRGRDVVILPDNDEAGRKYAEKAARDLKEHARSVFTLQLPGLEEGEDIVEWIERGGTRDELLSLLRRTRMPNVRCMSEINWEEVDWLWDGFIPKSGITLLTGDPGTGKSTTVTSLIASITSGIPYPDGSEPSDTGNVLLFAVEDSPSQVVRPRLEAQGADVRNVYIVDELLQINSDIGKIREAIEAIDPLLIVFDPIMSFLGGKVDANRANEVREVMKLLDAITKERNIAMVVVRHTKKGSSNRGNPDLLLYAGQGSIDFVALARSELQTRANPQNAEERLLIQTKCNLGPLQKAQAYRIDEGRIEWLGERDITADSFHDAAAGTGSAAPALSEAKDFIRAVLKDGPMRSKDLADQAKENGISKGTLERAYKALGEEVEKTLARNGDGKQAWYTSLRKPVVTFCDS
ncbi:MAG: AAA family ATPase, partial [Desulfurellales bacterium]